MGTGESTLDKVLEKMMFGGIYLKRRVLITGYNGFKGSYLSFFLRRLGAEVSGIALPAEGEEVLSEISAVDTFVRGEYCDIRDKEKLEFYFQKFQPEIVFHLAAQSLVRKSYEAPLETFSTNVMGTANILDCCRRCDSLRAIVVVSSDKCYENRETLVPYKEEDPLGGFDPYSASKGCTEIVASSYRRSFFSLEEYGKKHHILLASCRAGNVVGGGDYACDRLVPDLVRGALAGEKTLLRNPASVRPWQHVLEPLSGYLAVGAKLLAGEKEFAESWNFGPEKESIVSVEEAAFLLGKYWDRIAVTLWKEEEKNDLHEAKLLLLDSGKAGEKLKWKSIWNKEKTFEMTAKWYKSYHTEKKNILEEVLEEYLCDAGKAEVQWRIS